jgi:hypothetical protein
MHTTPDIAALITLLALNGACLIGLDRAPARGYALGELTDVGPTLIDPPTGWRKLWRPLCLYGAAATAIATATVPPLLS